MPRQETRTLYTLEELKTLFPEAYKKVHDDWIRLCDESGDCPWADDTVKSLEAVVKACGGRVKNYELGPEDSTRCWVTIDVDAFDEDDKPKDADWLKIHVLHPNGYAPKGVPTFPGLCKWTGYCADDDMIEHVHRRMVDGDTLTEALEDLASVAGRLMQENADQAREEGSMEANWSDRWFTKDGEEA